MENNEGFSYTYSAAQQQEVERIRKKYLPETKEEDKLARLRRLDESCSGKATALSLIVGVVGTLLLGVGMCCTLVWSEGWFIPGIVIGVVGIGVLCCAYPLYNRVLEKERQRIAPEILRLTEELLK